MVTFTNYMKALSELSVDTNHHHSYTNALKRKNFTGALTKIESVEIYNCSPLITLRLSNGIRRRL